MPSKSALTRGWVCALLLVCVATGCSKRDKSLSDVKEAFEGGDYTETVALCKYAIRRGWDSAETYYYYGAALVELDRDYEGFSRLDEAVAKDMTLAPRIAAYVLERALETAKSGDRQKAALRMQKAAEYDPAVDLGPYRFLVADAYFAQKNYGRAAELYKGAIEAYPDTSMVQTAYFNMASCYAEMGWNAEARDAYDELLARFPRGEYKTEANWRVANLMYEDAEKQNELGNYEETVEIVKNLIEKTNNGGLLQKSHFLLGETYEAMGDFQAAYREYKGVIDVDRGASGRIVERAREKIAALEEAGLF